VVNPNGGGMAIGRLNMSGGYALDINGSVNVSGSLYVGSQIMLPPLVAAVALQTSLDYSNATSWGYRTVYLSFSSGSTSSTVKLPDESTNPGCSLILVNLSGRSITIDTVNTVIGISGNPGSFTLINNQVVQMATLSGHFCLLSSNTNSSGVIVT
jgi:hypothetical protein